VYIETELKKLGLVVQRQSFSSGANIIGIQKGQSSKTIIIGSHYDSISGTPGADDNASGCAMTLLVARQLSRIKLRHTIRYIFFDAEERGLIGSSYYAKNMQEHCDFMVNFDMIGCLRASSVGPDVVFSDLFKRYPWAKAITFRQRGPSDHASFQKRGIPCAWIFTGVHPRYHKSTDTPHTLNYEGMVKINQYVLDLILSLDKRADQARALIESLPIRHYTP
jgi:Zn-dependent M28 family amino/carboxypeptidase